jgi:hypothetical protein
VIAYVLFCRCCEPQTYTVSLFDMMLRDAKMMGRDLVAIVHIELRNDRVIATLTDLESLEATRG